MLDRMLISLDLAGVFRKIKGLIIGGMTNMGDEKKIKTTRNHSMNLLTKSLLKESKIQLPYSFGFPNGHIF